MNMIEFLEKHHITMNTEERAPLESENRDDAWFKTARHWVCTFTLTTPAVERAWVSSAETKTTFAIPFHQGSAHTTAPTACDVMDCLRSDADCLDREFEEWAGDLGYDKDSRKAERIHAACVKQTKGLREFLGVERFAELLTVEPE